MRNNQMKQRIWASFYALSESISFDRLTVEKIVAHCGISKATFYRHFRDKYDLLNYNALGITRQYFNLEHCGSWHEFFVCMFREIDKDVDYYRRAFRTSGQNAHSRFLYEYTYGIVKDCYLKSSGRQSLTTREHYVISHYCHGCVDTLEDWLQQPDSIPGSQMAALFFDAMPNFLKRTWVME
ncbi:MAG: TetR/AcrR family transcriptional regulator C-terminal domain-containing protein [Firmicutes bacterium]|nr:TetR/AcrR family transcriptional regulator C-terminal domain-containing protein [Bacillota bacterium]